MKCCEYNLLGAKSDLKISIAFVIRRTHQNNDGQKFEISILNEYFLFLVTCKWAQ
jgi:hypothetical protein